MLADLWHAKWEQCTVQVTQESILECTVNLRCSWNIHIFIPNGSWDTPDGMPTVMLCGWIFFILFLWQNRILFLMSFKCLDSSFFSLSVWRNKFTNSLIFEGCYHFKLRPIIFSHMPFFFLPDAFPQIICISKLRESECFWFVCVKEEKKIILEDSVAKH